MGDNGLAGLKRHEGLDVEVVALATTSSRATEWDVRSSSGKAKCARARDMASG